MAKNELTINFSNLSSQIELMEKAEARIAELEAEVDRLRAEVEDLRDALDGGKYGRGCE